MAQLSVADLHAIYGGKPVPTPAPAPERGAREPDPVYSHVPKVVLTEGSAESRTD